MNNYIEDYFSNYDEFLTNEDLFYAIISLLPTSYIYDLIIQLENYKDYLKPSDNIKGTPTKGRIKIINQKIQLTTDHRKITLLELPPVYDL